MGSSSAISFSAAEGTLSSQPVFHLPDQQKPYILRTDASDVGLGAVLLQEHEDGVYPVSYLSCKLNGPEKNYSVSEEECLAIVWTVNNYVAGLPVRQTIHFADRSSSASVLRSGKANKRACDEMGISTSVIQISRTVDKGVR